MPRYVTRDDLIVDELHPTRGGAAGCGLATTMVKLSCLDAFEKLQKRHANVKVDVYIDDITFTSEGSEAVVLERLVSALKDLIDVVQDELSCNIECSKAAVVSSNDVLTKRIQNACGIQCDDKVTVPNLGVGFSCGRTRKKTGTTRKFRIGAAKKRKGRLYILRKILGANELRLLRRRVSWLLLPTVQLRMAYPTANSSAFAGLQPPR